MTRSVTVTATQLACSWGLQANIMPMKKHYSFMQEVAA
ncbi:Uncharacterised protein [Leminorella richardii]|uniref:Uncharacterized protein n=1 Tax=Leminorella richardii TaxID=158841 RepID=A0A2X4UA22_9GAMM|nr:Uncharacterised protein [Leminorella richardii]